jgi:predicted deacylase
LLDAVVYASVFGIQYTQDEDWVELIHKPGKRVVLTGKNDANDLEEAVVELKNKLNPVFISARTFTLRMPTRTSQTCLTQLYTPVSLVYSIPRVDPHKPGKRVFLTGKNDANDLEEAVVELKNKLNPDMPISLRVFLKPARAASS